MLANLALEEGKEKLRQVVNSIPLDPEMLSEIAAPQGQGSGKNAPNARLGATARVPTLRAKLFQGNLATLRYEDS